tara:strand:- start:337 stop:831 length:495 start_codon:yes stop_codon:yes gene_type:complete
MEAIKNLLRNFGFFSEDENTLKNNSIFPQRKSKKLSNNYAGDLLDTEVNMEDNLESPINLEADAYLDELSVTSEENVDLQNTNLDLEQLKEYLNDDSDVEDLDLNEVDIDNLSATSFDELTEFKGGLDINEVTKVEKELVSSKDKKATSKDLDKVILDLQGLLE